MTPRLLDDLPETDRRYVWLELQDFAGRVTGLLREHTDPAPVLIAGDWGAGKTTVLRAIEHELAAQNGPPTIWFDAWRHEGESALLPVLLRRIWEDAPKVVREDSAARKLFSTCFRAATALTIHMAPVAAGAAGLGLLASLLKGLSASGIDRDLTAVAGLKDLEPAPDPVAQLREHFKKLVQQAWPDQVPIVFVDDLDRCSPEGAVALLDGLRALISDQRELSCRFVVAMDRGMLAQAVLAKFQGIRDYDGNRFIEKLFPLAFSLPQPGPEGARNLVGQLLDRPELNELLPVDREVLRDVLSRPMFANPRLMKRCINHYLLVQAFEAAVGAGAGEGEGDFAMPSNNQNPELAMWIAATQRWPDLRVTMLHNADRTDYWGRLRSYLYLEDKNGAPDPDSERLLAQSGIRDWIRDNLLSHAQRDIETYCSADRRLRRWGL